MGEGREGVVEVIRHHRRRAEAPQKAPHVAMHPRPPLIGKDEKIGSRRVLRTPVHARRAQHDNALPAARNFKGEDVVLDLPLPGLPEQGNGVLCAKIGAGRKENGEHRPKIEPAMPALIGAHGHLPHTEYISRRKRVHRLGADALRRSVSDAVFGDVHPADTRF